MIFIIMKSKEVLKVLKISRQTLCKYVKNGTVKAAKKPNGAYDYDTDSVLKCAGLTTMRSCVIYARVSTHKQQKDLQNQIALLSNYAIANGFIIDKVYKDTASGLSYDRGEFKQLLEDVIAYKVKTVFMTNKDRLTRVSFDLWRQLFKQFSCDIIVANETNEDDNSDKEIFSDIISLLHCFAMKMYSKRRKKKINLIAEDMENEISA